MSTITLSDAALALLKRNLTGAQILVNDENREPYRELARGPDDPASYLRAR